MSATTSDTSTFPKNECVTIASVTSDFPKQKAITPVASEDRRDPKTDRKEGIAVLERKKEQTKRPKLYRIILHNDDYTTQDFVTHILMYFFRKDAAEARALMLKAHISGQAIIGLYTKDIAESKVAQVTDYARSHEHPLLLTCEPDE